MKKFNELYPNLKLNFKRYDVIGLGPIITECRCTDKLILETVAVGYAIRSLKDSYDPEFAKDLAYDRMIHALKTTVSSLPVRKRMLDLPKNRYRWLTFRYIGVSKIPDQMRVYLGSVRKVQDIRGMCGFRVRIDSCMPLRLFCHVFPDGYKSWYKPRYILKDGLDIIPFIRTR